MQTFGLSAKDFETLKKLVIDPLKQAGFILYVFGSRARKTQQEFSDIDILVETPKNFNKTYFYSVKEAIEEARFPIKVDFVLCEDLAKSYTDQVQKEKLKL